MSRVSESRVIANVPTELRERIEARADAADVTISDVVRAALVREVESDTDARHARAVVEAWLSGASAEELGGQR